MLSKKENRNKRTIIFCNQTHTVKKLHLFLRRKKFPNVHVDHQLNPWTRANNVQLFRERKYKILLASDIISRGLDFPDVEHVILYDFPFNAIDFLHRVGRTGRCGKSGRVTALFTSMSKPLVRAIKV